MPTITNYNLTALTSNNQSMLTLLRGTSEATNYLPGTVLWWAIYIIIFLALKAKGTPNIPSFAACNFIIFTLTLIMYPIGIISGVYLVVSIALLGLSVFLLYALNN